MKFIHIADVHLGATPDIGYPWSSVREKEIWDTFREVVLEAGRTDTDLLLIAGDLFHGQPLVRELKEVSYLFEQIPKTLVVLIAGNHDYVKKDSNYLSFQWPGNVAGLWREDSQVLYLREINTYVYGISYRDREIREPVYNQSYPGGRTNFIDKHADAIHILLGHGGDEKHIPIRFFNLKQTDFDYIALGHIHQPTILAPDKMAYAGSLEPLDRNHTGKRGYIRGEIKDGITHIEFVPAAKREYIDLEIPVTPQDTWRGLTDKVQAAVREKGIQNIYRITLTGRRDPDIIFFLKDLEEAGQIIETVDETALDYDFEDLEKQYAGTVTGNYIAGFLRQDEWSDVQQKALYYGVQALLEARE